jgi:hypothetical protein
LRTKFALGDAILVLAAGSKKVHLQTLARIVFLYIYGFINITLLGIALVVAIK